MIRIEQLAKSFAGPHRWFGRAAAPVLAVRDVRLEAADGRITPHVSHVYPLSEFKTAMRAKWNGEVSGGCVLHP